MPATIDYSPTPPPTDSQPRRQLRFMIAFAQLICLSPHKDSHLSLFARGRVRDYAERESC